MKKLIVLILTVALMLPGFVSADIDLSFSVVGHGPVRGELGLPLKTCSTPDGAIAVIDGATRLISVFDTDGYQSSIRLPEEIERGLLGNITSDELINEPFMINRLDMLSNDDGGFYILTDSCITQINKNGEIIDRIGNFDENGSMITTPIAFDVDADKMFYVLDAKKCVVVLDPEGKQMLSIGKVGEGKEAVANPSMVWESNGLIIVLDHRIASPFEMSDDEEAITIWDKTDGRFVRTVGHFATMLPQEHEVFASWTGEVTGDDIYLLDMHPQLGGLKWVIRHFSTNGDFNEMIECPSTLSNPITSAVFDVSIAEGELFICQPFSSRLFMLESERSLGVPSDETLKIPVSVSPTPDGGMYILEATPACIHEYDDKGNHIRRVPIHSKAHGLPGLDLTVGIDILACENDVLVATGDSILTLDPDTLKVTESIDNAIEIDSPAVTLAMATSGDSILILDTVGNVTIYTDGLPITFSAKESVEGDTMLCDIATTQKGDILVLDPVNSAVAMFSSSGNFKKIIEMNEVDTPSSLCVNDKGIIFVTSMTDGKVYSVSTEGVTSWESGENGTIESTATVEDYRQSPGMMSHPSRIRAVGDYMAILDFGNYRAQMLSKSEDVEPEKNPAKLVVEQTKIDFGETVYYQDSLQEAIQIKNTGDDPLTGTVTSSSDKLIVSPAKITDENLVIYVKYDFSIEDAWTHIEDQTISIQSNGGNYTIAVSAVNVVGKTIFMDVGNPIFRVDTVGETEDFETDRAPVIRDGRTYVPLRALGDVLGAEIGWDGIERVASFSMDGNVVKLWIDTDRASVNGDEITLENPPIIIDDSTYVPVRFVSENLGAGVGWISETRTVEITYPVKPE
jgi:hypothetical protein